MVEVFTAEGCASCPPADALLRALDDEQPVPGAQVIPLELHIAYWNARWHDRFSAPSFTERQRSYHRRGNVLYTPEMVVDGRMQFIGSQRMLAEHAIARAVRTPKATLVLSTQDPDAAGRIRATIAVSDTAAIAADDEIEIWAAVTETGLRTAVLRGENAGRDLRHAPVVRQLVHVATRAPPLPRRFSERIELSLASDWTLDRLRLVAFLQEPENRRVWGVAQTSVSGQAAVSGQ